MIQKATAVWKRVWKDSHMREYGIISQEKRKHRAGMGTAFKQLNACHTGEGLCYSALFQRVELRSKGKS